jgi:hypothetical protein
MGDTDHWRIAKICLLESITVKYVFIIDLTHFIALKKLVMVSGYWCTFQNLVLNATGVLEIHSNRTQKFLLSTRLTTCNNCLHLTSKASMLTSFLHKSTYLHKNHTVSWNIWKYTRRSFLTSFIFHIQILATSYYKNPLITPFQAKQVLSHKHVMR